MGLWPDLASVFLCYSCRYGWCVVSVNLGGFRSLLNHKERLTLGQSLMTSSNNLTSQSCFEQKWEMAVTSALSSQEKACNTVAVNYQAKLCSWTYFEQGVQLSPFRHPHVFGYQYACPHLEFLNFELMCYVAYSQVFINNSELKNTSWSGLLFYST